MNEEIIERINERFFMCCNFVLKHLTWTRLLPSEKFGGSTICCSIMRWTKKYWINQWKVQKSKQNVEWTNKGMEDQVYPKITDHVLYNY